MSLAWESVTPRPLPLPLGEVAERSEDGEGKQRRAASLCEAAQCSHWVVRRSVAEVSRRSRDGGIVTSGRTAPSAPTIVYRTCALLLPCHSEPVTDVTGVGIRNHRPLPLPLGEVAERSEDGEGKQKRTALRRFFQLVDKPILSFRGAPQGYLLRGAKRRGNP